MVVSQTSRLFVVLSVRSFATQLQPRRGLADPLCSVCVCLLLFERTHSSHVAGWRREPATMARMMALRQPRPEATTMTSRAPHRVRSIAGPAWLLDCRWVVPLAAVIADVLLPFWPGDRCCRSNYLQWESAQRHAATAACRTRRDIQRSHARFTCGAEPDHLPFAGVSDDGEDDLAPGPVMDDDGAGRPELRCVARQCHRWDRYTASACAAGTERQGELRCDYRRTAHDGTS